MVAYKWNKAYIAERASRYHKRGAFRIGDKQAYEAARRQQILDDVCSHMDAPQKKKSKEEILNHALGFKSMIDFKKRAPEYYDSACKRGFLKDLWKIFDPVVEVWTIARIASVAAECKSRGEFKEKYPGAYQRAQRMGVLQDVCAHMPNKPPAHVYVYCDDTYAYVGVSSAPKTVRRWQHQQRNDMVGTLSRKCAPRLLTKVPLPRNQALALERQYILEYTRRGYKVLNVKHKEST